MEHTRKISFHEAALTGIRSFSDGTTRFLLDGVHVDGRMSSASVCLKGVCEIVRDGIPVESVNMEYEDGEVLTLEMLPDSLRLIIEWNDFENHRQETRLYRISCSSTDVEIM